MKITFTILAFLFFQNLSLANLGSRQSISQDSSFYYHSAKMIFLLVEAVPKNKVLLDSCKCNDTRFSSYVAQIVDVLQSLYPKKKSNFRYNDFLYDKIDTKLAYQFYVNDDYESMSKEISRNFIISKFSDEEIRFFTENLDEYKNKLSKLMIALLMFLRGC